MSNDVHKFLMRFTDPKIDRFSEPISAGAYSVATNGHLVCIGPAISGLRSGETEKLLKAISKIIEQSESHDLREMDVQETELSNVIPCHDCAGTGVLKPAEWVECDECLGLGERQLDTEWNTYFVKCKGCEGDGGVWQLLPDKPNRTCETCDGRGEWRPDHDAVWVRGAPIQFKYYMLLKSLPDVKVRPVKEDDWLVFRSGEFCGAIMRLNREWRATSTHAA